MYVCIYVVYVGYMELIAITGILWCLSTGFSKIKVKPLR